MIFTKDRISSIVFSILIMAGIFAPWTWATWAAYGGTAFIIGFFSIYSFFACLTVLQRSEKTVFYGAAVANKRMGKDFGIIGNLVMVLPIVLISGSWILTSDPMIGGLMALSWFSFWLVSNRAEDLFYQLDEESQKEFIELIRKKKSS
jgi:hypothetical protein